MLRRLRASAARPRVVLGAQLLVTFLISLAGSVLLIAMAALAYHIHAPHSLAGFSGAWLLWGALFSALGVLLASIPSSRGVLSAWLGLFFTMMMLSGAGPPPEVLTGAMQRGKQPAADFPVVQVKRDESISMWVPDERRAGLRKNGITREATTTGT